MKEIEKKLIKNKEEIDKLQIPNELENRLRSTLDKRCNNTRSKRTNWKTKTAAACIAVLLLGYNLDTLAFYSKRLIGYDQIMNGTLKQLNELGNGQSIDKSYTFENGSSITLDGIMLDENQLLVFYTIMDPKGNVDDIDIHGAMTLDGLFKSYTMKSATGKMNKEKTEISYIGKFSSPFFLEKKLDFKFSLIEENKLEEGNISFKLNRDKAMGHTLKKVVNKTIEVDETAIKIESVLASPTGTFIKGEIQNILELAKDHITGERFRPNSFDLELIANGKKVAEQGGSLGTDYNGIRFQFEYDALPQDLSELKIKLVSFGSDHDVDKKIKINKASKEKNVNILGQNIKIDKVYEDNSDTYITITTEESVILTKVYLIIDGKKVELKKTVKGREDKLKDGTIIYTRSLIFPETGKNLELEIQRMTYEKKYNRIIDISL